MDALLQKTCLKPSYLLRKQLLVSFGITSLTTLLVVVTVACVFSFQASSNVKTRSNALLEKQALERIFYNSRNVADTFSSYLENIEGTMQILVEIVQDRIVGYPLEGWERDLYVPFIDMDDDNSNSNSNSTTRRRKYPLQSSPIPLDWQFDSNVNLYNSVSADEHLQERADMMLDKFDLFGPVSTAHGSYFFQGTCDPLQHNPESHAYMKGCTDAHNNITSGGIIQPTKYNQGLYEKSADISVLLKPIYEAQKDTLMVGVYFHNAGAGSYMQYPGMLRTGAFLPYTSMGCDWMLTINPYTQQPYGTPEEFARCHPKGVPVQQREYNCNERAWLHHLVLNPHDVQWYGPFYYYDSDLPVLLIGRSIFDRITGQFIGTGMFIVTLDDMNLFLKQSSETIDDSEVSIVHLDDSVVLADTLHTVAKPGEPFVKIYETNLISKEDYEYLRDCTLSASQPNNNKNDKQNCYIINSDTMYTAYPLNEPNEDGVGKSDFLLIHSIPRNALDNTSKETNAQIDKEVISISFLSFAVGTAGMVVVMLFVWYVSGVLTKPLTWMERVAWGIVNHKLSMTMIFHTAATEENQQATCNRSFSDDGSSPKIVNNRMNRKLCRRSTSLDSESQTKHGRCTPSTEIDDLVTEFRTMIKGFSGSGASSIAQTDLHEVKNELTWQSDYQALYSDLPPPPSTATTPVVPAITTTTAAAPPPPTTTPAITTLPAADTANVRNCINNKQNAVGLVIDNIVNTNNNSVNDFKGHVDETNIHQVDPSTIERKNIPRIVPAPPKRNFSSNILCRSNDLRSKKNVEDEFNNTSQIHTYKSSLFWWMILLMVVPLLIADGAICYFVSTSIFQSIPSWIHVVRDQSLLQEVQTADSITFVKSLEAEMVINKVVRDLHMMTRVAGWLLFDGIQRSDSFTEMEEATEECKLYPGRTCPFYSDKERATCACDWEDKQAVCPCDEQTSLAATDCVNYTQLRTSRIMQKSFYMVEKRDYDPTTGNRSFVEPKFNDTPANTVWWSNHNEMPGHELNSSASGYDNIYSRVRVASAMSVISVPLYRYTASLQHKRHYVSSMIAFEADGMLTGYTGCIHQNGLGAQWKSTLSNRASEIATDLCPLGKYGYDPRCRAWYATGKNEYNASSIPVHVTAPYQLALTNISAASITSPITIPGTNLYAGQMLLNFYPLWVKFLFRNVDKPVKFLITSERNKDVNDVVVYGSGDDDEWKPAKIIDLLFANDPSSSYRTIFEENVLPKMKSGVNGSEVFNRTADDGSIEQLTLNFYPVYARSLLPIKPSDYSRGVNTRSIHFYTVGIAYRQNSVTEPWENVQDGIDKDVDQLRAIYISVVGVVSFVYIFVTCRNTINITRPMLTLLRVVRTINEGKTENGIPPLQGGSREVLQVYNSFTKLYKIVRVSNVAFFSGNLKWAYEFISDALKLFRKVGDDKAIGIACSNLGNTLHAMYHDALTPLVCQEKFDCTNMTKNALQHYDEAIRIAEWQLERAEDEEERADFAQQLADRLFNRALLLLLMESDGFESEDLLVKALEDISRVRTLDNDLKMFWIEKKLLLEKTHTHFFRLLQRSLGLLEYYEITKDVWDADDVVREADQLLFASWDKPTAPLFEDVSPIGRLQQLESVAIKLELRKGRNFEAGRLAMRMFAEDEYLIEDAFKVAGDALLTLYRDPNWQPMKPTARAKSQLETDLRRMLRSCRQINIDIQKCVIFAFEINESLPGDYDLLEQINSHCLDLYDCCCLTDDYMGVVAHTQNGDLNVSLGLKSEYEGFQRSSLDLATTSTNKRSTSSYPYVVQMLIDCNASTESDSFVLMITDPVGWKRDFHAFNTFKEQVKRLNTERYTKIHVIVLGINIRDQEILDDCKGVKHLSNMSSYMDINPDNIDYAFETIRNVIRGGVVSAVYNQGILMEKF